MYICSLCILKIIFFKKKGGTENTALHLLRDVQNPTSILTAKLILALSFYTYI